jgi:hypothetical protein
VADYFVIVDSCVLIDLYVEIIRTGATPKGWDELKTLVADGKAKLLVPEITLMEFRKWVRQRLATLPNTKFEIVPQSGNESFDAVVDELLAKVLRAPLNDWLKKTEPDWRGASETVLNSLIAGEQIKFTPETEHRTKRRLIEGLFYKRPGKPDEKKRDQDCFIIDSLVGYFDNDIDGKNLFFGTKDGGFGVVKEAKDTVGKTGPLDKLFQGGLPPTQLFTSLVDLVKFINANGTVNFLKGTEQAAQEEEQEVPVMVEIEGPVAAPKHYVLDAEPGRFGMNETVVSVPSTGGRVIDIVVRDHVTGSDSLAVTTETTTTTTTPPPDLDIAGGGWIHYGPSQSQRRADELARIRQDEERRRRNAAVHQVQPSFFAPAPATKSVQIAAEIAGPLAGQSLKRWIDPEGVAWQLSFTSFVPVFGEDAAKVQVLVTLDRRNADGCTENVSEACDRLLRSLRFSYHRVVPQRRQGGVSFGPYVIEEQEPERPVGNPFDPNEGLRAIEDAVKSGGRPNPEPKPEEPKKEPEPPEEPGPKT